MDTTYKLARITIEFDIDVFEELWKTSPVNNPKPTGYRVTYSTRIYDLLYEDNITIPENINELPLDEKLDTLYKMLSQTEVFGDMYNTDHTKPQMIYSTNYTRVNACTKQNMFEGYNCISRSITTNSFRYQEQLGSINNVFRKNKNAQELRIGLEHIQDAIEDITFEFTDEIFTSTIIEDDSYVFSQLVNDIRNRYAMMPMPTKFTKHTIIDSFIPKELVDSSLSLGNICERKRIWSSRRAAMIHRGLANALGISEVPMINLIEILGYTIEDIRELLVKTKANSYKILFTGIGGVGMNTLYWLYEMCNMCQINGIFEYLYIYDKDTLTIDNLIRMPMPFVTVNSNHNMYSVKNAYEEYLDNRIPDYTHYRHPWPDKTQCVDHKWLRTLTNKNFKIYDYNLDRYTYIRNNTQDNSIVAYGAPNMRDRSSIQDNSSIGAFICATHGNNDCSLDINPTYDDDSTAILRESYGVIQLNVFFLNQIRLAIGLLEILSTNSLETLQSKKDENFLTYSAAKIKKCKYNLAIQETNTIG